MPDDRLAAYADMVRAYASRIDLVSAGDLERFEERHIADSLRLTPLLEELPPGPAIDVGSGAGLPGIPLAITGPERHWRLLEPRRRRAAFLDEVVRELELGCEVLTQTAEEAGRDPSLAAAHALATARALAPPKRSFTLLMPLVAPGGAAVAYVGPDQAPPESRVWREGLAIVTA